MVVDMSRNPLPIPTAPERAPWEEVRELTRRLDELIRITKGEPAVTGIPTTSQELVSLVRQLVPESLGDSATIPFMKTVAAATQDEEDRSIARNGNMNTVVMAFPAGCHQLVKVRLMYFPSGGGFELIVPSIDEAFIALDDFTLVFQPNKLIKAPGKLRVEWWNYDSLNTHSVPVIVTISPTGLERKA